MNNVKALFHRGWQNALNPWFDIYFLLMQRRIIMMFTIMRTKTVMIINNGEDDDDNDDGSLKASLIWHLFRSAALNHHALTDMSCARWLISHHFVYLRVYTIHIFHYVHIFENICFIMFILNILRTSYLFIENMIFYFLSMATAHCVEHELHWLISKADADASFLS